MSDGPEGSGRSRWWRPWSWGLESRWPPGPSPTRGARNRPFVAELAEFARDRLPKEAVLLFEVSNRGEHQLAMFLLDRTCYQLQGRPTDEVARQVRDAGGLPYIITANPGTPWNCRFVAKGDPRALYEWQAPAMASKPVERLRGGISAWLSRLPRRTGS